MEQQLQEFVQLLSRYVVMIGVPGLERPAILVPAQLMAPPRSRHLRVRSTRGTLVRVWYVQYRDHLRWAFAEEDTGSMRLLLLHRWAEEAVQWGDYITFRTLRQPRRGHRLTALHGRRVSVSYSVGLEDQLVVVMEEGNEAVWWVLYMEGPGQRLVHLLSVQTTAAPVGVEEYVDV